MPPSNPKRSKNKSNGTNSNPDAEPRSIPGYHYNTETKKYYKILEHGSETGSDGAYTDYTVKKAALRKQHKKIQKATLKHNISSSQCCKILSLPHLQQQFQTRGGISMGQIQDLNFRLIEPFIIPEEENSFTSCRFGVSHLLSGDRLLYRKSRNHQETSNLTLSRVDLHNTRHAEFNDSEDLFTLQFPSNSSAGYVTHLQQDITVASMCEIFQHNKFSLMFVKQGHDSNNQYQILDQQTIEMRGVLTDLAALANSSTYLSAIVKQDKLSCVSATNVETSQSTTHTCSGMDLKLAAHKSNPHVAYLGTRTGQLFGLDCREKFDHRQLLSFDHDGGCIRSMTAVDNEDHLVTSHINGVKCLFDRRSCKVITKDDEVISDVILDHGLLKTDETKKFITTAGDRSGFIRIWDSRDLRTRHVIRLPRHVQENYSCELTTLCGMLRVLVICEDGFTLYH